MTRTFGGTAEEEKLSDTDEPARTTKDVQSQIRDYDANHGIPDTITFGVYLDSLLKNLVTDGRLPPASRVEDLQQTVAIIVANNEDWDRLIEIRASPTNVSGSRELRKKIRAGAPTLSQWTRLWAGLGGYMRWPESKEARRRQRVELSIKDKEDAEDDNPKKTPAKGTAGGASKSNPTGAASSAAKPKPSKPLAPTAPYSGAHLVEARRWLVGSGNRKTAVNHPGEAMVKNWGSKGK